MQEVSSLITTNYDLTLEEVAQDYEIEYGREQLIARLSEHLNGAKANVVQQKIVELPTKALITTNYDLTLEEALKEVGRESTVIYSGKESTTLKELEARLWQNTPAEDKRLYLIKLYGDLQATERLLIGATELDFYSLNYPHFGRLLEEVGQEHALLYIGYQPTAENFRRLLRLTITKRQSGWQCFILLVGANERTVTKLCQWGLQVVNLVSQNRAELEMIEEWLTAFHEQIESKQLGEVSIFDASPSLPAQPYKFLDFFTRKDSALFHGRADETAFLYRQLLKARVSVLYGESGTGKTSLLQAAFLPRLKKEGYTTLYLRLLDDPLAELRLAIIQKFGKPAKGPQMETLASLLTKLPAPQYNRGLVLVLDEVERLFSPAMNEAREAFMTELGMLLTQKEINLRLLLSVRNDYLDRLDELTSYLEIDPLDDRMRLPHLSLEGARAAFVEPALAFGLPVDDALTEQVLKELQQLGLRGANLQIIGQALWEQHQAEGEGFSLEAYRKLGGGPKILQSYLDRMLDKLNEHEERLSFGIALTGASAIEAARLILKSMLIAKAGQEIGQKFISLRDIASLSIPQADISALLNYLEKRRLIRRIPHSKNYELIHSVMIERIWEWFGAEERLRLNLEGILERTLMDYEAFGWYLPLNQLELVKAHAKELNLNHKLLCFLLVSAIEHDQDAALWIERLDSEDVVRLLGKELARGKRVVLGSIIRGLGLSAHPKAMPYLEQLLNDKDNKIQRQAVESLLRLNMPKIAQTLYHAARREEQLSRVVPLVEGIERLYSSEAIQLLNLLASDHTNPHVRSRAANGLAYLGHPQGISLIAQLAANDDDSIRQDAHQAALRLWEEKADEFEGLLGGVDLQIKQDAIRVLQMVGKEEVSPLLIKRLNDPALAVQEQAAAVLLELTPLSPTRFEGLREALEAESCQVHDVVIRLLADLADKRAIEPLLALLLGMRYAISSPAKEAVRLAATTALGKLYPLPLLSELGSPEAQARQEAAQALGYIHDKRTIEPLMTALWDSHKKVRAAVAKALGELASESKGVPILGEVKRAVTPLLIALQDNEPTVRAAVALALGEMASLSEDITSRIIEPLASKLNDDQPEVRIAAARALGQHTDARLINLLVKGLEDKVPEVRMVVAKALERLQTVPETVAAQAVEPLLIALNDDAPRVRMAAAEALGKSGQKRAIPALEKALKDYDYLVRLSAISALGSLYPHPTLKALGAEEAQIRREAAEALGQASDLRMVEPLIAVLADDSPMVTIAAVNSLGQLGHKEAAPALVGLLAEASPQIRMAIARALGQLQDERAVEPMIAALSEPLPKARRRAALVLGKLGSSEAVEPLINNLTDHDSQVRMAVAKALGHLGDRRAVKPLLNLLKDPIHRVRSVAAKALGLLGDRRATEALLEILRDEEFLVRQSATAALGALWHLPLLRQLGYYRDARARSIAASALKGEECNSPIGRLYVEALIAALQDKAPRVRLEAAQALGHLKDERAIAPLKAAKDDKNPKVRIEISRALRQLKQLAAKGGTILAAEGGSILAAEAATPFEGGTALAAEAATPLLLSTALPALAQLSSEHATLRRIAAETLGLSNDERAVEPLIQALADEEVLVRVAVVRALERLNDKRAIQPLIHSLQEQSKIVRLATISALGTFWDLLILVQLGSEQAEERQLAAAQSDRFVQLQREGNLQIVEPLLATLYDDVATVREAAVKTLGILCDKRATVTLLNHLKDNEMAVRIAVGEALERLDDRRAIAPLVEALRDNEALVRLSMIRALGSLYNLPALYDLGALDAEKRINAAKLLGKQNDGRAAEPLIALLRDESSAVRLSAANALRDMGEHALDSLFAAFKESNADGAEGLTKWQFVLPSSLARRYMARIFGQLRQILEQKSHQEIALQIKLLLRACLQDADHHVRQQAAISLRQLADHEAISGPLRDLHDAESEIRSRAASVLGHLRDKAAVEPLIRAGQDRVPAVREEAARSLGLLRDGRAEKTLLKLLEDEQLQVRHAATQALGQLWQEATLVQLGSEEAPMRLEAIRVLARGAKERFVEPLGAALCDVHADVRLAAAKALGQLGYKKAVDWLVKALHDPVEEVQKSVAEELRKLENVRDVERLIQPAAQPSFVESSKANSLFKREEYLKQRSTMRALGALWNRPLLAQLGSEKAEIRLQAARLLAQTGDLYAVKPLLMALTDESLDVCCQVAEGLAGFRDERIAEALLGRLSSADARLSLVIVDSLGQLGDQRAIRPLLNMLDLSPTAMQVALVRALVKLKADEAVGIFEKLLLDSRDERLRSELVAALATLHALPLLAGLADPNAQNRERAAIDVAVAKDARAIPLLLAILRGADEPPFVRSAVIDALVSLARYDATDKLVKVELIKCLEAERGALDVRRAAIRGLGVLYALPDLCLLASLSAEERLSAIERVMLLDGELIDGPLVATLLDDHLAVRLGATRALAQLWKEPALLGLGDSRAEVRSQAARALGIQGSKRAFLPLLAALEDPDAAVRRESVHALGFLGNKEAIPSLIRMLSDGNSKVRGRAATALQLLGKDYAESLLSGLYDSVPQVRRHVARILGGLGYEEAITPLVALLQDGDLDVRQQAAISLRQLGTERAIVPVLLALRDNNPLVRERAASVMGQLRDLRVLKPLIAALEDEYIEVRREAARSLGQLRDERAVKPLIKVLHDEDIEMRRG